MKTTSILLLPALASAAAINPDASQILEKRQGVLGALASYMLGPAKQSKVVRTAKPEYDAKATRQFITWGPFKLPASNATHAAVGISAGGPKLDPNSDSIAAMIAPPCSDCTVLKAIANLAYADGTQADVGTGVYTHHIIMTQIGRKQLTMPVAPPACAGSGLTPFLGGGGMGGMGGMGGAKPAGAPMSHSHSRRQTSAPSKGKTSAPKSGSSSWMDSMMPAFSVFVGGGGSAGSGSAFAAKTGDVKSGVYIGSTDTFQFTSEIVNYDPKEKDIYLSLDFEWLPGKVDGLLDVGMGALSVTDCAKNAGQFVPPKDKAATYKGQDWTVTDNGYFVNFTPHLHDGGSNIKIILNGKEVCESKAIYGADGSSKDIDGKKWETISGYSACEHAIKFKKGDKVAMTAEYDLTKHALRPDSKDHDMGAEAMALANFMWAKSA